MNDLHERIRLSRADRGILRISEDPGSYVALHWHDAFELIYLLEGQLLVEVEIFILL